MTHCKALQCPPLFGRRARGRIDPHVRARPPRGRARDCGPYRGQWEAARWGPPAQTPRDMDSADLVYSGRIAEVDSGKLDCLHTFGQAWYIPLHKAMQVLNVGTAGLASVRMSDWAAVPVHMIPEVGWGRQGTGRARVRGTVPQLLGLAPPRPTAGRAGNLQPPRSRGTLALQLASLGPLATGILELDKRLFQWALDTRWSR